MFADVLYHFRFWLNYEWINTFYYLTCQLSKIDPPELIRFIYAFSKLIKLDSYCCSCDAFRKAVHWILKIFISGKKKMEWANIWEEILHLLSV